MSHGCGKLSGMLWKNIPLLLMPLSCCPIICIACGCYLLGPVIFRNAGVPVGHWNSRKEDTVKEKVLHIPYMEDLLLSLKESKEQFEQDARFLLAVKLYELGKISSGKAAKLAGLRRVNFLLKLGEYKVSPFQVSMNEILEEAGR